MLHIVWAGHSWVRVVTTCSHTKPGTSRSHHTDRSRPARCMLLAWTSEAALLTLVITTVRCVGVIWGLAPTGYEQIDPLCGPPYSQCQALASLKITAVSRAVCVAIP